MRGAICAAKAPPAHVTACRRPTIGMVRDSRVHHRAVIDAHTRLFYVAKSLKNQTPLPGPVLRAGYGQLPVEAEFSHEYVLITNISTASLDSPTP